MNNLDDDFIKCKSCQKLKRIATPYIKKQINAKLKNKTYKIPMMMERKIGKQRSKCNRCKRIRMRRRSKKLKNIVE